jgi:hypothetical protein
MEVYRGTGDKQEINIQKLAGMHEELHTQATPPCRTTPPPKYQSERIPQSRYHVGCDKNNSTHAWD